MSSYKTKAIVLKSYKLGEADKIIKLFSRENGPIDAIAKGSRKIRSRFGGRLELFNFIEAELVTGRNLDIITQAGILKNFKNISLDFNKYLFCQLISEVVLKTHISNSETSSVLFKLIYVCFNEINSSCSDDIACIEKIAVFFLAKFLKITGYAPLIKKCTGCSRDIEEFKKKGRYEHGLERQLFFSINMGGIICNNCALKMKMVDAKKRFISDEKYNYLCILFDSNLKQLRNIDMKPGVLREITKLIGDYIKYHTDCKVDIFSYFNKIVS